MIVGVYGAAGFVGTAVTLALRSISSEVVPLAAPRVEAAWGSPPVQRQRDADDAFAELATRMRGLEAVVNCAGLASPSAARSPRLYGANAHLPLLLRDVCRRAGVPRFIHVSSAAVQGRRDVLDETEEHSPASPYAAAKAAGERLLLTGSREGLTIFRPTSVHGIDRLTTARLAGFARSSFSSVAGPGEWATPQVLVQNVGSAIAYTATCTGEVPVILIQPSEGHTARSVLRVLGLGREPRHLPECTARGLVSVASVGRFDHRATAWSQRLQMLWFGQPQCAGWLSAQGLSPIAGSDAWAALAASLAKTAS